MKNDTEWLERDDTMRDIDSNFGSIAETATFHAHAEKNDDFPCKFKGVLKWPQEIISKEPALNFITISTFWNVRICIPEKGTLIYIGFAYVGKHHVYSISSGNPKCDFAYRLLVCHNLFKQRLGNSQPETLIASESQIKYWIWFFSACVMCAALYWKSFIARQISKHQLIKSLHNLWMQPNSGLYSDHIALHNPVLCFSSFHSIYLWHTLLRSGCRFVERRPSICSIFICFQIGSVGCFRCKNIRWWLFA